MLKITGKLLIDDYPIQVLPRLAAEIGLNEAIFLQQLHYWLNSKSAKLIDGHKWIYNTYKDWNEQFPFWSVRTIKRIVENLEKKELIIKGNYNKKNYDKTIWYTINYEEVSKVSNSIDDEKATCQNGTRVNGGQSNIEKPSDKMALTQVTDWHNGEGQIGTTNTIDYTEITSKTTKEHNIKADASTTLISLTDADEINQYTYIEELSAIIGYYAMIYSQMSSKSHPRIKEGQLNNLVSLLEDLTDQHALDYEDWLDIIDSHFEGGNYGDGNINYFAHGDKDTGVIVGLLEKMGKL